MEEQAEPGPEKAERGPALTRKILAERVQAATGAKMKDVKTITEAVLSVMGEAVKAGEAVRLPPFGMGRPKKPKEGADPSSPKMMFKASTKVRAPKTPKAPKAAGKAAGAGAGKGRRAGKKAKGVETPAASE